MDSSNLQIDRSKLVNLKTTVTGFQAQCPACFENNEDITGKQHLSILRNGKFNCIKYSNSSSHNVRILQLVGVNADPNAPIPEYVTNEQPKITLPESWPIDILKGLVKNYDYWNKRGISNETCEKFQIGTALKGKLNQRSVIPIFNKLNPNKLVGFSGRALYKDQNPKYKIIGTKSLFVFPAFDEEIRKVRKVLIIEGGADALYLYEHGIKCTLCCFGVVIGPQALAYLIRMNPDEILIGTNNEPENKAGNVGLIAAKKIEKQLQNFFGESKVKIALPEHTKDFADATPEYIREYKAKWNL